MTQSGKDDDKPSTRVEESVTGTPSTKKQVNKWSLYHFTWWGNNLSFSTSKSWHLAFPFSNMLTHQGLKELKSQGPSLIGFLDSNILCCLPSHCRLLTIWVMFNDGNLYYKELHRVTNGSKHWLVPLAFIWKKKLKDPFSALTPE